MCSLSCQIPVLTTGRDSGGKDNNLDIITRKRLRINLHTSAKSKRHKRTKFQTNNPPQFRHFPREREPTLAKQNPKTVKAKTQKSRKKESEEDRMEEEYLKSMSRQLPSMFPHHNSTIETAHTTEVRTNPLSHSRWPAGEQKKGKKKNEIEREIK